jgi:D-3-phosphoglycerate dehydrogenase / 2-oxoglutarate reductase
MKVFVTCPPMLGMINHFKPLFEKHEMEVIAPKVVHTMPVEELGVPTTHTPNMLGGEDVVIAMGYVILLARETIQVDEGMRRGEWPKPRGISLFGKAFACVQVAPDSPAPISEERKAWPPPLPEADFTVVTSSLTPTSRNMVDAGAFAQAKHGVRVVNDGRGTTVDEPALEEVRKSGKDYSAALEGFEVRPLLMDSYLRIHPWCIFGAHNASNTADAVERTSEIAIE